jgi:hypothetical protein
VNLYSRALAGEPEAFERIKRVRIGPPSVKGDTATVQVQEPGGPAQVLPLVKSHGEWRISGLRVGFARVGSAGPTAMSVEPPRAVARTGGEALAQFYRGRAVTAQSGCLACPLIGVDGNAGPGPDLTRVGTKLSPQAIERALVTPTESMPSFRHLPKAKLKALVTFLSLLRG